MADPSANQVQGGLDGFEPVQDDAPGTPSVNSVQGGLDGFEIVLDDLAAAGGLSIPVAMFSYRQLHQGGR